MAFPRAYVGESDKAVGAARGEDVVGERVGGDAEHVALVILEEGDGRAVFNVPQARRPVAAARQQLVAVAADGERQCADVRLRVSGNRLNVEGRKYTPILVLRPVGKWVRSGEAATRRRGDAGLEGRGGCTR